MKDQDLDKLFRDQLVDHEVKPTNDIWNRIEDQLQSNERIAPIYAEKKTKNLWFPYAAAACFMIFLGIAYFAFWNGAGTPNLEIQIVETKQNSEKTETIKQDEKKDAEVIQMSNTKDSESLLAHVPPIDNRVESIRNVNDKIVPTDKHTTVNESIAIVVDEKPSDQETQYAQVEAKKEINVINSEVKEVKVISSIEADPVKPLIENPDEEDFMFAQHGQKSKNSIVTNLLNVVSDNLPVTSANEVKFSNDDEGSIRIDLGGLFARNRNKRR